MIRKIALFTTLVILLATNVKASEVPVKHVKDTIVKHSVEMGVDPALALSIAKVESGYSHKSRSPHGAVGVFQLMPSTAKKMGVNPYHLNDNIRGGLMYYKMLYKMFGSTELALAAYHTGPAYVLKYRKPAPCSKRYISGIMKEYYQMKAHTDPAIKRHNDKKNVQANAAKKQVVNKPVKPAVAPVQNTKPAGVQVVKKESAPVTTTSHLVPVKTIADQEGFQLEQIML